MPEPAVPGFQPVPVMEAPSYLLPPRPFSLNGELSAEAHQMISITLRSCGDKRRDVLRMQRVLGLMRSSPGKDRFSLQVFEGGHGFLVEFPNNSTGVTSELIEQLVQQVGPENVRVEPLL